MRITRRLFVKLGASGLVSGFAMPRHVFGAAAAPYEPRFELVQPELFAISGGQPNCWADFNNDGVLDLFVGFKDGVANRLYRNEKGRFSDVAGELGLGDPTDTRAAAWGDPDADGH